MLVAGGVWEQPLLWLHLETADQIVKAYLLRDQIKNWTKFSEDHLAEAMLVIECDKLAELD